MVVIQKVSHPIAVARLGATASPLTARLGKIKALLH
jgi:hypothetical protein